MHYPQRVFIGDSKWLDFGNVPGFLDWVAFVLGTAGIGFTIWQLIRSRGALNAARKALVDTRNSLIKNQLVALLPAFRDMSSSIDDAMMKNKRPAMGSALANFSNYAHEAVVLLGASTPEFDELIEEILAAAEMASEARAGLYRDPTLTTQDIAEAAATSIRNLSPKIRGASLAIQNDPGKAFQ